MIKPVVLVHGAWHGAWCFRKLVNVLQAEDIEAIVVELPLAGTAGDVEVVRQCLEEHPGAVVMGHSYGGLVITHACLGLDVSHLVYLCALMPQEGENINETVASAPPATALEQAMVPGADGTISINPDLAGAAFYDDCDPEDIADAVLRLRAQVFEPFPVLENEATWEQVPSTYVICQNDKALHPALQRKFAERAGAITELPSAHSPFLSRPEEVRDILVPLVS